jgi:sulfur carrier protein ThiS adenylyltransferase
MKILLNEQLKDIDENTSLFELKEAHAPESDIWIYNGFPVKQDVKLEAMDTVFFITRGVVPSAEMMEQALVSRHTPGVHAKVKKAVVGIAGLGGLGSNIAIMLARVGVGKLILVDFDVVEPSNLNRQQYFIKHIGQLKTDALKSMLVDINPYIEIVCHTEFIDATNIDSLFSETDIIVEAFDAPASKALLVNYVLHHYKEKYIVAASGLAGYFSNNTVVTKKVADKFYLIGDDESEAQPGCGLMAPRASLAASHQANTVIRIIMGESEV